MKTMCNVTSYSFKIHISGIRVHGSTPWLGSDSIIAAATALRTCKLYMKDNPSRDIIITSIDGGDSINVMAENCTFFGKLMGENLSLVEAKKILKNALDTGLREAPGAIGEFEISFL